MTSDPQFEPSTPSRFYLPSLEGLRFVAFLLVFLQHLPRADFSRWFAAFQEKGSIGVDIFFALSAFLLGSLVAIEKQSTAQFDFVRFMWRRVLRIMPLLCVYVSLTFLATGQFNDPHAWARAAGSMLLVDNFLCWFDGYSQVPATAHLWTLSYEMQVYPLIPVFALIGLRHPANLARLCIAVIAFSVIARAVFVAAGAVHPLIWVTPFLRPESLIAGILLAWAVRDKKLSRGFDRTAGIAVTVLLVWFLVVPLPHFGPAAVGSYIVIGAIAAGAVWTVLRIQAVKVVLGSAPMAFLGRISYGLYLFHLAAISAAAFFLRAVRLDFAVPLDFLLFAAVALAITMALASAAFFMIEYPFLKFKRQFESVPTRPLI